MIKIAGAQYAIELLSDWQAFTSKVETVVSKAKDDGAQLLLLPEYCGIEVTPNQTNGDLALFKDIQPWLPRYLEFYQQLAKQYQMYIQPGTIMVETANHQFNNRAYFFSPSGNYGYQDKMQLVVSEKSETLLQGGTSQTLFKTSIGLIGIAVCYDSEFPEIVRNLANKGAKLILVPSYTPSMRSFLRVYHCCHARAIENQCYVLMASAIHNVYFGGVTENLVGQVNLFSPIDEGFPENGILAQGLINESATIVGSISYEKLEHVRKHGQVLNFNDSQANLKYAITQMEL